MLLKKSKILLIFCFMVNLNGQTCFVAGHSGGHLLPALELAKREKIETGDSISFFSAESDLDKSLVKNSNYVDKWIKLNLSAYRKSKIWAPLNFFQFVWAFLKSFFCLIKDRPKRIVSMGGVVSVPVCLAGWILRIPIDLYELNASPGKAIKFLSRFAKNIYYCFDEVKSFLPINKSFKINYPLRFAKLTKKLSKKDARYILGVPDDFLVLFLVGGSQGSVFLNSFFKKFIKEKVDLKNLFIFHQIGKGNLEDFENFYKKLGVSYKVFSYVSDIEKYYLASDIVFSRAGAGTLFELEFFDKAGVLIPLETSYTGHQVVNAYAAKRLYPERFLVLNQEIIKQNFFEVANDINDFINITSRKDYV